MQNRDHTTSLLLLDASTAPSTDTDPWTHWIDFLKRSPATRTLPSPHLPHKLANPYGWPHYMTAISEQPAHGITLSPVKCRSCLAPGPCRFPLRPISTCPQPVVTAVKPKDCFTHPQESTLRPTHCMVRPTASICRKGPPIGRYTGNREKIKAGFSQLCYLVAQIHAIGKS